MLETYPCTAWCATLLFRDRWYDLDMIMRACAENWISPWRDKGNIQYYALKMKPWTTRSYLYTGLGKKRWSLIEKGHDHILQLQILYSSSPGALRGYSVRPYNWRGDTNFRLLALLARMWSTPNPWKSLKQMTTPFMLFFWLEYGPCVLTCMNWLSFNCL